MLASMVSISWPCDPPTSASQSAGVKISLLLFLPVQCFLGMERKAEKRKMYRLWPRVNVNYGILYYFNNKKHHREFSSLHATTENTEATKPRLGSCVQLRIKLSISKHNSGGILMLVSYDSFFSIPQNKFLTELTCASVCVSGFQHCF